ncbi:MAG TPA: metalloregulator ArsR/SmtB family transcription factor [Gaiellaceae bacterium]
MVDLSRPAGVGIEIEASEAAEVLMSICCLAGTEFDTFELGEERIGEIRAGIDPELLASVNSLAAGPEKIYAHLLGLVYESPSPRTFPAFLQQLEATEPLEVQLVLLGYYMRDYHHVVPPDAILAAAQGDAAARAHLLELASEYSETCLTIETLFDIGADELKRRLLAILPRWYDEVFRPLAPEALDAAERDAAAKRELASTRSAEQMVELATNGIQYAPGPAIRKVVLFPTYVLRPWVMFIDHKDVRMYCYGVGQPLEAGEAPAPAQLARVFKALGDEGRLRVLKRLSEGPLALGEAAEELGVAKSTAHHHLAILRQAGLVLIRPGPEKVYTLRPDLLPQTGSLLDAYLRSSNR